MHENLTLNTNNTLKSNLAKQGFEASGRSIVCNGLK